MFLCGSTNLRLKNELKRKGIILRIKDKKRERIYFLSLKVRTETREWLFIIDRENN